MALTITNKETTVFGNKRIRTVEIAFGSLYPTGGESLTPTNLGLAEINILIASPKSGYTFEYDYINFKLKAYRSAGFTPAGAVAAPTITTITNATPTAVGTTAGALSQVAGATGITGVQAPAFTGTAVAQAALAEVTDTTDLSAVTGVRILAIGV